MYALVLVLLLGMMLQVAQAQGHASSAPMKLIQVSPHAYYVEGASALGSPFNRNFISNAGVIVAPDGVIVVDALGSPALAQELIGLVRGVTDKPIKYVIVTHYHADHIYGLQTFTEQGATVIAHAKAKEYLGSDTATLRLDASRQELAPWVNDQTRLVPAGTSLVWSLTHGASSCLEASSLSVAVSDPRYSFALAWAITVAPCSVNVCSP